MKKLNIILLLIIPFYTKGQHKCARENLSIVKSSLIECFGDSWYNKFNSDENNKVYIKIILKENGDVFDIPEYKIYKGMTTSEFKELKKYLICDVKFCVYNPESEISFEKFKEINSGKLPYGIIFSPSIMGALNSDE